MPPKIVTALLAFCAVIQLQAAQRSWKSEDGRHAMKGEFIKRDATAVTIRRTQDRKEVVIPLEKIHPDDRTWLNANHPLPGQEFPDNSAVFDKLSFGETRDEVIAKLKTSKFVELSVPETFLGRTGLNDVFRTRRKIGGLDASLYFDWTAEGKLKEITLQTKGLPESAFKDQLTPCWKEFTDLLTTIYGKPVHAEAELKISAIQDGTMLPSHLWNLDKKGSASLGAARDGNNYQIVVRFTEKTVELISVP